MFGIDSSELAIIALVALLVIGPKDLPRVMRQVGQWMAKGRAMTRHVRAGFDTMMRESELEEMQAQWAAQNDAIMKATALPDLGIRNALPDYGTDSWTTPAVTAGSPPPEPAGADPAFDMPIATAPPPAAKPRQRRAKPAPAASAAADPAPVPGAVPATTSAPGRKRGARSPTP